MDANKPNDEAFVANNMKESFQTLLANDTNAGMRWDISYSRRAKVFSDAVNGFIVTTYMRPTRQFLLAEKQFIDSIDEMEGNVKEAAITYQNLCLRYLSAINKKYSKLTVDAANLLDHGVDMAIETAMYDLDIKTASETHLWEIELKNAVQEADDFISYCSAAIGEVYDAAFAFYSIYYGADYGPMEGLSKEEVDARQSILFASAMNSIAVHYFASAGEAMDDVLNRGIRTSFLTYPAIALRKKVQDLKGFVPHYEDTSLKLYADMQVAAQNLENSVNRLVQARALYPNNPVGLEEDGVTVIAAKCKAWIAAANAYAKAIDEAVGTAVYLNQKAEREGDEKSE